MASYPMHNGHQTAGTTGFQARNHFNCKPWSFQQDSTLTHSVSGNQEWLKKEDSSFYLQRTTVNKISGCQSVDTKKISNHLWLTSDGSNGRLNLVNRAKGGQFYNFFYNSISHLVVIFGKLFIIIHIYPQRTFRNLFIHIFFSNTFCWKCLAWVFNPGRTIL